MCVLRDLFVSLNTMVCKSSSINKIKFCIVAWILKNVMVSYLRSCHIIIKLLC